MNTVCLVGNLTRDPELRHLASGTSLCELSIAVNDRKPDGNGGWTDYPHYFDITTWGKVAENCSQFLAKGKKVAVTGKLEQDRWQNEAGENRSKVKVNAFQVDFLTPKGDSGGSPAAQATGADFPTSAADDDIPF